MRVHLIVSHQHCVMKSERIIIRSEIIFRLVFRQNLELWQSFKSLSGKRFHPVWHSEQSPKKVCDS